MSDDKKAQKAPVEATEKAEAKAPEAKKPEVKATPDVVEPTLKELQAEAVELGMPEEDALTFRSKKPLQATINALRSAQVEPEVTETAPVEEDKKRVVTLDEKPNVKEEKTEAKIYKTKRDIMRAKLEKQQKIRFFLPLTGQEQVGVVREVIKNGRKEQMYVSGAVETVQLNGYKIFIPKGVYVDIPEQVADVLSDSLQLTRNAGAEFLTNRINPETGQKVSSRLD